MTTQHGHRIIGKRGYGGIITVKILLNQIYRLSLLVDTGAAMTAITPQVATDMGFDLTHPSRWLEIASVHQIERVPVIQVNTLQVGGQKIHHLEVTVLPLPPNLRIDGLLGSTFCGNFAPHSSLTKLP